FYAIRLLRRDGQPTRAAPLPLAAPELLVWQHGRGRRSGGSPLRAPSPRLSSARSGAVLDQPSRRGSAAVDSRPCDRGGAGPAGGGDLGDGLRCREGSVAGRARTRAARSRNAPPAALR